MIKKILLAIILTCAATAAANAWKLETQRTLGNGEGKNQNVLVRCTTATGQASHQTCSLRRYAKCTRTQSGGQNCTGWQPWTDVRNPGRTFGTWQEAANACCRAHGLR
ncbi:MAG: hypothetical protein FWD33_01220 [Alphaproteobacteria bacterium]|nr:hypothetical protein [Alphaproteobacteria bacterium]